MLPLDVVLHKAKSHDLINQPLVTRSVSCAQGHETEGVKSEFSHSFANQSLASSLSPVVGDDYYDVLIHPPLWPVLLYPVAPGYEAAAVDVDHDGEEGPGGGLLDRAVDVEIETVLLTKEISRHCLTQLRTHDNRVLTQIHDLCPWLRLLGRDQPQVTNRGGGEGDPLPGAVMTTFRCGSHGAEDRAKRCLDKVILSRAKAQCINS